MEGRVGLFDGRDQLRVLFGFVSSAATDALAADADTRDATWSGSIDRGDLR